MQLVTLKQKFNEVFEVPATSTFFAPGRINLVGEHIDYNGGLVFPCAITLGTYGLVSLRNDNKIRAYSMNFEKLGVVELSLDNLSYNKDHEWCNYVKGVITSLKDLGVSLDKGFNLLVFGNIPNGAGLSSSASLEILISKILSTLYNFELSPVEAALLGQKVENNYIGVNSGIMDQFAIALGKEKQALLLNCNTQYYEHIPFELTDYSIIIMNTNKRRELADSKYNERRGECDSALALLKNTFDIESLCDLKEENLDQIEEILNNPIQFKRVKHAITENTRVINATRALTNGDLVTFGKLLIASHTSLRDDYEVTGIELDTLVKNALEQEGVLGARMTGAGFGGCSLAIVENGKVDTFINHVGTSYKEAIGYEASFYTASIGNGPTQLD